MFKLEQIAELATSTSPEPIPPLKDKSLKGRKKWIVRNLDNVPKMNAVLFGCVKSIKKSLESEKCNELIEMEKNLPTVFLNWSVEDFKSPAKIWRLFCDLKDF